MSRRAGAAMEAPLPRLGQEISAFGSYPIRKAESVKPLGLSATLNLTRFATVVSASEGSFQELLFRSSSIP